MFPRSVTPCLRCAEREARHRDDLEYVRISLAGSRSDGRRGQTLEWSVSTGAVTGTTRRCGPRRAGTDRWCIDCDRYPDLRAYDAIQAAEVSSEAEQKDGADATRRAAALVQLQAFVCE